VIDYGITIHGHPLREYLSATNHAQAYQYVTALVDKHEPLSRDTILTLHALVMDKILETKGCFRRSPVYIRGSNMTPPAASEVERLMREWVAWVHGEGLSNAPVTRAAIAHHGEDRRPSL
jgi:Fic family protein